MGSDAAYLNLGAAILKDAQKKPEPSPSCVSAVVRITRGI